MNNEKNSSNKSNGNKFEQELAKALYDAGFWVHVLQQNKAGQPADIVAIGKDYAALIDCKVISNANGFKLSRVEENQRHAMTKFYQQTGHLCWFALKFPDGKIHLVSSTFMFYMISKGHGTMSEKFIRDNTYDLESWLNDFKDMWGIHENNY